MFQIEHLRISPITAKPTTGTLSASILYNTLMCDNKAGWVLRIVYKDNFCSFETLLEKDKAVKIHVRNRQVLVKDIFKVKNSTAPNICLCVCVCL